MNKEQIMLIQLAEEAGEVTQMCSKSLRFGLGEIYDNLDINPNQLTNKERLQLELWDLLVVARQLGLNTRLTDDYERYVDCSHLAFQNPAVAE